MSVPDLTYTDAVLSSLVTSAFAATATADVDSLGPFSDTWRNRLILFRVYILVCLEYASTSDDPFSLKLAFYRTEYDKALTSARSAVTASSRLFTIPLERA